MENKGTQIVTIKSLTKLYKNNEEASFIELANCEEHNFDIVVQKGLYLIGDKALYVQPDFNLPLLNEENTKAQVLFSDFTAPDGNSNKSKLGKNGRIRAIKFNFTIENSGDATYSMGLMLPLKLVLNEMSLTEIPDNLDEVLEITKYEEPEKNSSGLSKGSLPLGMYSTDETNINNCRINYPITLTGNLKTDGSSISIYYKNKEEKGICSRNLEKHLVQKQIVGYVDEEGNKVRKHYDRESGVKGFMNEKTNIFITEIPETYTAIEEEVEDTFVKLGKPILDKLEKYCEENNLQLTLRGELCGQGCKGSGNKLNPHANLKQQILFYGVDDYSSGITKKVSLTRYYQIINDLELNHCDTIFEKITFNNFDEIKDVCENYFKENLIEGIVLRNEDITFSAKYMCKEYDSRK